MKGPAERGPAKPIDSERRPPAKSPEITRLEKALDRLEKLTETEREETLIGSLADRIEVHGDIKATGVRCRANRDLRWSPIRHS